jgi:hypothetical protein
MTIDRSNETVPSSSERFNENGRLRRFAQRIAQPLDGGIETVIEVNEGVRRPKPIAKVFAGNQLAGMLQKQA